MSDSTGERRLRCPACRAGQAWRAGCRRCGADLRLLVRALTRVAELEQQYHICVEDRRVEQAAKVIEELRALDPQRARELESGPAA